MRLIKIGTIEFTPEDKQAVLGILESGQVSEGSKVREFERAWADYCGTKYCVLLNSGTSALIAGLEAAKQARSIPEGSTVITTPLTFIATTNAITIARLTPVYVDVDRETFNITPETIQLYLEGLDSPDDHAMILPVHLMGYPCDMTGINKVAKRYGLAVFEDAAEAHGAQHNGKRVGSLGLMGEFSFFIAHNIQVGELGALTTDDLEIRRLVEKIKAHGRTCDLEEVKHKESFHTNQQPHGFDHHPRYYHDIVGYNFKAMEFQAVLALEQLKKADWILERRQENVKYLNEGLQEVGDILHLPLYSQDVSYLGYPLVINKPGLISRMRLRKELEDRGIETRPLFGCIPLHQPSYMHMREEYKDKLPNAEYLGQHGFYIAAHQYLTQEDLDYIIKTLKGIVKK